MCLPQPEKQTEPTIGKTKLVTGDLPSVAVDLVQVMVPYTLTLEGLLAFRGHY